MHRMSTYDLYDLCRINTIFSSIRDGIIHVTDPTQCLYNEAISQYRPVATSCLSTDDSISQPNIPEDASLETRFNTIITRKSSDCITSSHTYWTKPKLTHKACTCILYSMVLATIIG